MLKKAVAEFIGTWVLVLFGTGTAVFGKANGASDLAVAMAFGLSILAMIYSIAMVSGCHVNPAVSVAMYINNRLNLKGLITYLIAQVLGAICASYTLLSIIEDIGMDTSSLGQNNFGELSASGAFLVEVLLTFVFVLVVIVATGKHGNKNLAGVTIAFTLVLVHLLGVPLTGTSVNPARSIGPAVFVGGFAMSELWLFIIAPIIGGIIAAVIGRYIFGSEVEKHEKIK